MSGKKEQKNAGGELRQPDQAEIEGAMRQIKDLPAHGDGLHLGGRSREKAGGGRVAEIGVVERGSRGALGGVGQVPGCQDLNVVVEREFVRMRA